MPISSDSDTAIPVYMLGATGSINDPGRYNNPARRNCNLVKMQPVMIGVRPKGQLKLGGFSKMKLFQWGKNSFDYNIK